MLLKANYIQFANKQTNADENPGALGSPLETSRKTIKRQGGTREAQCPLAHPSCRASPKTQFAHGGSAALAALAAHGHEPGCTPQVGCGFFNLHNTGL